MSEAAPRQRLSVGALLLRGDEILLAQIGPVGTTIQAPGRSQVAA